MKEKKKIALLVVHTNSFFIELYTAGQILQKTGLYTPRIFFNRAYATLPRDIARCQTVGLEVIDFQGKRITEEGGGEQLFPTAPPKGWKKILKEELPTQVVKLISTLNQKRHRMVYQWRRSSFLYHYRLLKQRRRKVETFLRHMNPEILMMGGHWVGYDSAVYVQAAHVLNIPVVIVSSTMDNGQAQAESLAPDRKHSLRPLMNRLVGWLYPHWVRDWRGKKLIRMPWGRVLAMEWLGLAPPLPWVAGSGDADAIIVESEEMVRFYAKAGLPKEQMVNTGSLTDDILAVAAKDASARKSALCRELGLPVERPMLLCALPPDYMYLPGGRPTCDFQTYPALVEFWIRSLADCKDWNSVVVLHPSVRYEDMRYIEEWGVKIACQPTAEVVPLCDLYVTSVSSTIRWAIACSKPVVNYDVYRYHYEGFMHVKGVLYTEEQAGFQELLQRLTTDRVFLQQTAAEQAQAAPNWGFLDGRSGQRMVELLDKLIEKYEQEKPIHG